MTIAHASLQPLIRRCWQVTTPEGRTFASLVLSELQSYLNGWPHIVFKGKEQAFGEWISDPSEPSGYGLARVIHAVRNKDEQCAKSLVEASSAPQVAKAVSRATPETAYNLGELLSALHSNRREQWGRTLLTALERERLIGLARDWPPSAPAWAFANLCKGIADVDTALALKMVEGFVPIARPLLSSDPISAFRDLQEVFMRVLRLVDVLGIYKGKSAPTAHHRQLARSLLGATENKRLVSQLSASKLRDFQQTGYLLELIREVAVAKFRWVADAMDWERIGRTIDAEWKDLPHDAEVLLQVAAQSPGARSVIARVVRDHLELIESFSPRLVLLAPEAATEHARRGGVIRIARHGHVDWHFGAPVIAWFAQEHPSLLAELLEPSLPATARSFSQPSPTWYEEAAGYVELLRKLAPSFLGRVLDAVAAEGAEKGWSAARAMVKFRVRAVDHQAAFLV